MRGDITSTVGDFQSLTFFMFSTMERYHDTSVEDIQYPHIYHDIPNGTEHLPQYAGYPHSTEHPPYCMVLNTRIVTIIKRIMLKTAGHSKLILLYIQIMKL